MIDALLGDADIRRAINRLRPEDDPATALARVAWSVVAEPGDGVAGALISQLGGDAALRFALPTADVMTDGLSAVETTTARAQRALREGRKRWMPRADVKSVRHALNGAEEVAAQLVLPGDPSW